MSDQRELDSIIRLGIHHYHHHIPKSIYHINIVGREREK